MKRVNKHVDRSCKGKARHRSIGDARKALRASIREYGDAGLVYYFCRHCRGFHIGHTTKVEQKKLRFERLIRLIDHANGSKTRGGAN